MSGGFQNTRRISGVLGGVRGKRWKVLWAGQLHFLLYCLHDLQAIFFPPCPSASLILLEDEDLFTGNFTPEGLIFLLI